MRRYKLITIGADGHSTETLESDHLDKLKSAARTAVDPQQGGLNVTALVIDSDGFARFMARRDAVGDVDLRTFTPFE